MDILIHGYNCNYIISRSEFGIMSQSLNIFLMHWWTYSFFLEVYSIQPEKPLHICIIHALTNWMLSLTEGNKNNINSHHYISSVTYKTSFLGFPILVREITQIKKKLFLFLLLLSLCIQGQSQVHFLISHKIAKGHNL